MFHQSNSTTLQSGARSSVASNAAISLELADQSGAAWQAVELADQSGAAWEAGLFKLGK